MAMAATMGVAAAALAAAAEGPLVAMKVGVEAATEAGTWVAGSDAVTAVGIQEEPKAVGQASEMEEAERA